MDDDRARTLQLVVALALIVGALLILQRLWS